MTSRVMTWRKELLASCSVSAGYTHKLLNHKSTFGATHCVEVSGKFLFTSGFEIDSGQGYVNGEIMTVQSCEFE